MYHGNDAPNFSNPCPEGTRNATDPSCVRVRNLPHRPAPAPSPRFERIGTESPVNTTEVAGDPILSVDALWKVFGERPERALDPTHRGRSKRFFQDELQLVVGLHDVSFEAARGETFVIMGLSGSGKSTLVRTLIRLIEPTSGRIVIDGEEVTAMPPEELLEFRRTKAAMVFQHYGLLPHRTVLDNAAWGLEIRGMSRAERHAKTVPILELVGLAGWEAAYPAQLSGGMQQRVGLARALTADTDILLMDEPFSGLDPLIRGQMQDELIRLQEELRKTIIFITHDLDEALRLGDRIAILHHGGVAQIGSGTEIVLNPRNRHVTEFTRGVNMTGVLTAGHVMTEPARAFGVDAAPIQVLDYLGYDLEGFVWVTGSDDSLQGLLGINQVERLYAEGREALRDGSDIIVRSPPITPDMLLDTLIPVAMASEHPIPVTDAEAMLVGEIKRNDLARVLAQHMSDKQEQDHVPA